MKEDDEVLANEERGLGDGRISRNDKRHEEATYTSNVSVNKGWIRQNQLRKKIAVITGMEVGEKWFGVR